MAHTPVAQMTHASMRESFMYAQLAVRGEDTSQVGTPLTIELSREWDRWIDEVHAEKQDARSAPFRCCEHCPDDDPDYHERNPRDSHGTSCTTCDDAMRMRAEKAEGDLATARAAVDEHERNLRLAHEEVRALRARPALDRDAIVALEKRDAHWRGPDFVEGWNFALDAVLALLDAPAAATTTNDPKDT